VLAELLLGSTVTKVIHLSRGAGAAGEVI